MAVPIRPNPIKAFTKEKFYIAAAVANIQAITNAELNAVTTLDFSGFFFDDFTRPTQNTNEVTLGRRVMDGVQYSQIGITTQTGGVFWYSFDPQAAAGSNGKKAFERLPDGTVGVLIRRLGINVNTDGATAQFYSAWPIEVGPPFEQIHGDGEAGEVGIMQHYVVNGPIAVNKAFVA